MSDQHPIRIADPLWRQLGDLADAAGYKDGRGPHAALVRDILSSAVAEWNESPYVCKSAKHSFLITADGSIFYRQQHLLSLNSYRDRLPCSVAMKREKRDYFFRECPKEEDPDEWFKKQWLLNCFAVWQGREVGEVLLASEVDRRGTDIKSVDLPIRQDRGMHITREVLVAARDYVQWTDAAPGSDWIEVPVDMPTRNLEVEVFIDRRVYRNVRQLEEGIRSLDLEFRNRESARFATKAIASFGELPIPEYRGVYPDRKAHKDVEGLQVALADLVARFEFFADHQVEDGPVLDLEGRRRIQESLALPEEFLFYRMSWPSPHLGIEVCVVWDKPMKAGA